MNSLKNKADESDICKLEATSVDSSMLSDKVQNTEYNKLVKKVSAIDTILLKKQIKMLRSKILKIKYLILLSSLVLLILILKLIRLKIKYLVLLA